MAEGLLAHRLPADLQSIVRVSSAGINALQGYPAQEHAVETMAQIGVDIRGHRARQLTREMARSATLILTMEMAHIWFARRWEEIPAEKLRLLRAFDPQAKSQQVADPYGGSLADYQECLATLQSAIEGVVNTLKAMKP